MDAGNLGFSPCAQRSIRRFTGYDFLRYRPFLYDYGFRSYLPQSQKTKHGKTLQNLALSGYTINLSHYWYCILRPPHLVQTAIYLAWLHFNFTRSAGLLVHQQKKIFVAFILGATRFLLLPKPSPAVHYNLFSGCGSKASET